MPTTASIAQSRTIVASASSSVASPRRVHQIMSRCYARACRTRQDHGGLGPRNNRIEGGARKTKAVLPHTHTHTGTQKPQPNETTETRRMRICIYIQRKRGYNRQAGERQSSYAYAQTHKKSEMETLPKALGRSAEQSQPPETYTERLWRKQRRRARFQATPPPPQNTIPPFFLFLFSIPLPLFHSPREGGRYHPLHHVYSLSFQTGIRIDFLPNNAGYLGFHLSRLVPIYVLYNKTCTHV